MTGERRFGWQTGAVVGVVAIAVLVAMVVLANGSDKKTPDPVATTSPAMTKLQFAVWGNQAEVAAYQSVVDDYNASSKGTSVEITSWPDADAMLADLRAGATRPDLYMLPLSDLAESVAEERNRPLLDLLDEREIPIGDDFARDAVLAFSYDDDLQCMPYTAAPMVMYYNKALIDFEKMDLEGLPTPKPDHSGWNLAEFRAAAEFASRPRQKTRGVHIEPTLEGLAPFIYSGGGQLYDDASDPKSLALGNDDAASALRQTLELLRDPRLTLSAKQLKQRSALEWFKRGKLAMIAGFRGLTPELRATEGLSFDVMPMPSLGSNQTVGELNGVCLAAGRPLRAASSANFLTYLVSDEAVSRVAGTGYIQPAKLTVALSADFLQPGQAPEHAEVFNNVVRTMVLPPLMEESDELQALVAPDIEALLTVPVLADDLQNLLRAIDEKSRSLLDPDYEPSDDPSGSAPPSGSATPSDSAVP